MNEAQFRHAKAMARKIREHAERIVAEMGVIERMPTSDVTHIPISIVAGKFTHDMGYGVQDYIDAIQRVIADMLPDLEQQ